jgi:hypothetical protein
MSESNPTYSISLVGSVRMLTPGILADRRPIGPLAGLPTAVLNCALAQAQKALIDVVSGVKPVQVEFQEGTGKRTVTYTQTDYGQLLVLIRDIKNGLGIRTRRALGTSL